MDNYRLDYFETWKGQKELESIVDKRVLNRPRTTKFSVFLLIIIFVALIITIPLVALNIHLSQLFKSLIIVAGELIMVETLLRLILIKIVRCYQHYASEKMRRRCLCIPSCSEYTIAVLKRFPLSIALLKTRKRLFKTCKGELYLIDKPYRRYKI